MRMPCKLIGVAAMTLLVGCQDTATPHIEATIESSVPYITAAELAEKMAEEDRVLLVEFCVPLGCFRCEEMQNQIDQLASDMQDRVFVCRVNLNSEHALASQLGVTVCPSYIVFEKGREVFRVAYPTSGDLIAAQLHRELPPAADRPWTRN